MSDEEDNVIFAHSDEENAETDVEDTEDDVEETENDVEDTENDVIEDTEDDVIEGQNEEIDNDLEEEYIPDEEPEDEDDLEDEDVLDKPAECEIQFDSDPENELDEEPNEDDEEEEDENGEFDENEPDGIDIAEIYNDGPKKKVGKAIFLRRKKAKPKISRLIKKKKRTEEDVVVHAFIENDVREHTRTYLSEFLEDENNIKVIDQGIRKYCIRYFECKYQRRVKKSELESVDFKELYTNTLMELTPQLTEGNCQYLAEMLGKNMVGFLGTSFAVEKFKDDQETKYIETPPNVQEGDQVCRNCKKNFTEKLKQFALEVVMKLHENNEEEIEQDVIDEEQMKLVKSKKFINRFRDEKKPKSYTKTTFYQLQVRSADESITNFITCVNCGNKWTC